MNAENTECRQYAYSQTANQKVNHSLIGIQIQRTLRAALSI